MGTPTRHMHLEVYWDRDPRDFMDQVKAEGGHVIVHSEDTNFVHPDYITQPYLPEAYDVLDGGSGAPAQTIETTPPQPGQTPTP
jgi:hypothetical protein